MGYAIAVLIGIVVLIGVVLAFKPGMRSSGRLPRGQPMSREEPSADEPTPGASSTEDPETIARAQRRVPPA